MKQFEVEYKFKADHIDFDKFDKWARSLVPSSVLITCSEDEYFDVDFADFVRLRHNRDKSELTIKKKTVDKNNVIRIEGNMDITRTDREDINIFLDVMGAKRSFSITKKCNVYYYADAILALYEVFNELLQPRGKFLEVEANRDILETEEQALAILSKYEKLFTEKFDIDHHNRIKKSLYELKKTGVI